MKNKEELILKILIVTLEVQIEDIQVKMAEILKFYLMSKIVSIQIKIELFIIFYF
jgi:hypothetical protein